MRHFEHKFKCIACSLHFVVCSDYENWPDVGTTRDLVHGEATGVVYCPECGSIAPKLHWREEIGRPIYETVPGRSQLISFGPEEVTFS